MDWDKYRAKLASFGESGSPEQRQLLEQKVDQKKSVYMRCTQHLKGEMVSTYNGRYLVLFGPFKQVRLRWSQVTAGEHAVCPLQGHRGSPQSAVGDDGV